MSEIHFVGGEKGGVGKSVVARLLAQYLIDDGIPFRALDTDRSNGALMRYYTSYSEPIELEDFESADRILQLALDNDIRVLVDLASQSERLLDIWFDENGIVELARELGVRIVRWHVMEDSKDSVRLLEELQDRYGSSVDYVIVKNLARGKRFAQFAESRARLTAQNFGSPILDLPALHEATMLKIDRQDSSFWAAVHSPGCLGLMERQRAKVWLRKVYDGFLRIFPARSQVSSAPIGQLVPFTPAAFATTPETSYSPVTTDPASVDVIQPVYQSQPIYQSQPAYQS